MSNLVKSIQLTHTFTMYLNVKSLECSMRLRVTDVDGETTFNFRLRPSLRGHWPRNDGTLKRWGSYTDHLIFWLSNKKDVPNYI